MNNMISHLRNMYSTCLALYYKEMLNHIFIGGLVYSIGNGHRSYQRHRRLFMCISTLSIISSLRRSKFLFFSS